MEDRCVCCGAIIPEGIQICPNCDHSEAASWGKVLYLCNRNRCGEKCSFPTCKYTSRVTYAKKFQRKGEKQ